MFIERRLVLKPGHMSSSEAHFERLAPEIRQQMDGILALTEQLARLHLGADAQACVFGVAEAATSVRQILTYAEGLLAGSGDPTPQIQPWQLREVMDEVQSRWQRRASDNGVTLLVAYDGHPEARAMIDGERLMQAFDGFIGQAVASARRGAVEATLRATALDDGVRLEGRVRGGAEWRTGDDRGEMERIEADFGLEAALGVSLSRRIVAAMSGVLRVETNAGAGETVVFEFTAPVAAVAEAPAPAARMRTAHILVVDDNATNRMVAETLCEMFDCTSESATDGLEAIEAARTGRFDLILMDIKMPRMDGVAATKAIRALGGRTGRVPIIALTANADPDDAAAYVSAGMNGVVEKPMKPETLLQALQQALAEAEVAAAASAAA
jgi:CheY-like chemotaxis protein